jgi:mono/diheme cytochrome c family protein
MALLWTIEPTVSEGGFPTAQQLIASNPPRESPSGDLAREVKSSPAPATSVDFNRNIRVILERSCIGCHSGEKPKGGYDLATRDLALKGGQSGEPAIIPGHAKRSALLRFVQDQVEDLEMPPLGKRGKFPALTAAETAQLRARIDHGAPWPEDATLRASGN